MVGKINKPTKKFSIQTTALKNKYIENMHEMRKSQNNNNEEKASFRLHTLRIMMKESMRTKIVENKGEAV